MTDTEKEFKELFEKDGFGTNVPIFNDKYNSIISFDVARTLPEDPVEEKPEIQTEEEE